MVKAIDASIEPEGIIQETLKNFKVALKNEEVDTSWKIARFETCHKFKSNITSQMEEISQAGCFGGKIDGSGLGGNVTIADDG